MGWSHQLARVGDPSPQKKSLPTESLKERDVISAISAVHPDVVMIELDEERLEFMRGPNQRPVLQQFYYTVALVENDWLWKMWVFWWVFVCMCVSVFVYEF